MTVRSMAASRLLSHGRRGCPEGGGGIVRGIVAMRSGTTQQMMYSETTYITRLEMSGLR